MYCTLDCRDSGIFFISNINPTPYVIHAADFHVESVVIVEIVVVLWSIPFHYESMISLWDYPGNSDA